MKRTHDANIGGTIFHVEEDAYTRLETYLESVKVHFASYQDADIVTDIESRIAEQCVQKSPTSRIVTLPDVDRIINTMGSVDQFDDALAPEQRHAEDAAPVRTGTFGNGQRRLFRDPDDRMLAGIASGIAGYCGASPGLVRFVSLVSVIIGALALSPKIIVGAAVVYVLLWMAIPRAKTTTDKLQMRGNPITLASVEQRVREGVTTAAPRMWKPVVASTALIGATVAPPRIWKPAATLGALVGSIVRMIALGAVWAVGFAVIAGAAVLTVGLTAYLVMVLSNPEMLPRYSELPLSAQLGWAYYPFVICSYLLAVIPLVLVGAAVIAAFRSRSASRWNISVPNASLVALAVWLIALMSLAGLGASYLAN